MHSSDHQPGQAEFRSILSEDIDWEPYPGFPPSVRKATVVGDPTKPGPYTVRVKVPAGVKLLPHKHPEDHAANELARSLAQTKDTPKNN